VVCSPALWSRHSINDTLSQLYECHHTLSRNESRIVARNKGGANHEISATWQMLWPSVKTPGELETVGAASVQLNEMAFRSESQALAQASFQLVQDAIIKFDRFMALDTNDVMMVFVGREHVRS
jgi:hypothetical protein